MGVLEIKKYPDKVLMKKAERVEKIDQEIKKLGQDMVETMIAKNGIGLAAPQVGSLKRIITIGSLQENNIKPWILINPEIIKKDKKTETEQEGCLSFPGLFLNIKRSKKIKVKALDENGKELQIEAEGLLARVLDHEIDHLNGVLFVNRLGFWQRLGIKKKLKNINFQK